VVAPQIVPSCVAVYLVSNTALLVCADGKGAPAAALLYALEPQSILYCSVLLSESALVALLMSFIFSLCSHLNGASARRLVLAAASVAAATYVRPITYFLPFHHHRVSSEKRFGWNLSPRWWW
jgi:hypothetical protein